VFRCQDRCDETASAFSPPASLEAQARDGADTRYEKEVMVMVSLVVKIPLKEGKAAEYTEAFREMAAGVAGEEGCLLYSLSFPRNDPNTAVIMERYTDQEAFGFHTQTDHFKAFGAKASGAAAGNAEVMVMEEVVSAK